MCSSLGLSCMEFSALLELECVFPFLREFFGYYLFKYFSGPFFSFWDPFNANIGTFNVVPEVSWTVSISFHSFFLILFQTVISSNLVSSSLFHLPHLFYY